MKVPAKKPNQGHIETLPSNVFTLDDYRLQGLRVLARIIARVHIRRMNKKLESKNGFSRGKV